MEARGIEPLTSSLRTTRDTTLLQALNSRRILYPNDCVYIDFSLLPACAEASAGTIGLPGIEPGLHPPHGRVLPAYSGPCLRKLSSVGPPGIEPGLYAPEAYVLPAYSGPTEDTFRVGGTGLEPVAPPV